MPDLESLESFLSLKYLVSDLENGEPSGQFK